MNKAVSRVVLLDEDGKEIRTVDVGCMLMAGTVPGGGEYEFATVISSCPGHAYQLIEAIKYELMKNDPLAMGILNAFRNGK